MVRWWWRWWQWNLLSGAGAGGVGGGGDGKGKSGYGNGGDRWWSRWWWRWRGGCGNSGYNGGNGGSGIVVVRYQIASIGGTAKASGGTISFFGNKTIHSFVSAGDFNNTSGGNLSCDVVMIGGGGGGGHNEGGGGGAGGYIFQPERTVGTGPHGIIIGAGGRNLAGSGGMFQWN